MLQKKTDQPVKSIGDYPKLSPNTSYQNNKLGYKLLGFEQENERFWAIIDPTLVENQQQMNSIIVDIYKRHAKRFKLEKISWNISFFINEKEAGYKMFKRKSYLAEYWSKNSYDEENRNKIIVYPAYPSWQKWHHGPRQLSILEPFIPMQALMPPPDFADPEYKKLLDQLDKADTPWDKRQAEIALNRFAVKYTEKTYAQEKEALNKKAKEIIDHAIQRIKKGESAEKIYLETEKELTLLQEQVHRSWKGHGPKFLKPALERLNKICN